MREMFCLTFHLPSFWDGVCHDSFKVSFLPVTSLVCSTEPGHKNLVFALQARQLSGSDIFKTFSPPPPLSHVRKVFGPAFLPDVCTVFVFIALPPPFPSVENKSITACCRNSCINVSTLCVACPYLDCFRSVVSSNPHLSRMARVFLFAVSIFGW